MPTPLTVIEPDTAALTPQSRSVIDTVGDLLDPALQMVDTAGTFVIVGFDDQGPRDGAATGHTPPWPAHRRC